MVLKVPENLFPLGPFCLSIYYNPKSTRFKLFHRFPFWGKNSPYHQVIHENQKVLLSNHMRSAFRLLIILSLLDLLLPEFVLQGLNIYFKWACKRRSSPKGGLALVLPSVTGRRGPCRGPCGVEGPPGSALHTLHHNTNTSEQEVTGRGVSQWESAPPSFTLCFWYLRLPNSHRLSLQLASKALHSSLLLAPPPFWKANVLLSTHSQAWWVGKGQHLWAEL